MTRFLRKSAGGVSGTTYVELVGSLFATRLPTMVMSLLFVMVGWLAHAKVHDPVLLALLIGGTVASLLRLAVLLHDSRLFRAAAPVSAETAARVERRFAITYLAFAAILGAFGARSFLLPTVELHMAVAILLVGYAAGVAAGTALRPWISVSSLLLAIMPACIVAMATPDMLYRASAVCLLGFLAGGTRSIMQRYRSEANNIARRLAFSMLARQDHLTGLPNRLALAERFAAFSGTAATHTRLAVHCIDLDDFKPVNDRFGHSAGDALLQAVAERLRDNIRGDDFAARLGGDEFIFVQTGIKQEHEAEAMARRLERCLAEPYVVAGEPMTVEASIGLAIADGPDGALDSLVQLADDALRQRKAERKAREPGRIVPITSARTAGR